MDTILDNAVSSIQLGVEDYRSQDTRRPLSAVRNLTAGILLLLKERLRQLSPADSDEALLKMELRPKIDADGALTYVGVGKKTVDYHHIKERLTSLKVTVDWKRLQRVIEIRNEIEHYQTQQTGAQLKELLSDSFVVIRDFITAELKLEPVTLLGEQTWHALLDVSTVYAKELQECVSAKDKVDWHTATGEKVAKELRCSHCGSELLRPSNPEEGSLCDLEFHCSGCGLESDFTDIVVPALREALYVDAYTAMTDGGDPPIEDCEECGLETYVLEEEACVSCHSVRAEHWFDDDDNDPAHETAVQSTKY